MQVLAQREESCAVLQGTMGSREGELERNGWMLRGRRRSRCRALYPACRGMDGESLCIAIISVPFSKWGANHRAIWQHRRYRSQARTHARTRLEYLGMDVDAVFPLAALEKKTKPVPPSTQQILAETIFYCIKSPPPCPHPPTPPPHTHTAPPPPRNMKKSILSSIRLGCSACCAASACCVPS